MQEYNNMTEIVNAISSENKRLRSEITMLEEAIAWYGNHGNWDAGKAQKDRGGRARRVIGLGKPEF